MVVEEPGDCGVQRRVGTSREFDFAAPFLFDWEVQNVLISARRLDAAFYRAALAQLERIGVSLEPPIEVAAVVAFAKRSGLSLFDASYLKLAVELGVPIMSRDGRLVEAAVATGVTTYDLR